MEFVDTLVRIAVVFGLLFLTLRLLSRTRGLRVDARRAGVRAPLEIVDKVRVGRTSSVVTMRVGDRTLLLGVTEHQLTTLADVTDDLAAMEPAAEDDADIDVTDRTSVMDHALEVMRARFEHKPR
ncbi:MAG: flagellar biosynthetic protein FliO [Acidimicrobiales bacterium]